MKVRTIMADPPWPYSGGGPVGNGGRGSQDGKAAEIQQVDASIRYPLLSLNQIAALGQQIEPHLERNAHLYLWVTNSFMEQGHQVARSWGFTPKTILTWVKVRAEDGQPSMKTGYYYRSATEHCLFCVRGSLRVEGPCRPTAFFIPRERHSRKPDFFRELIEEKSPGPFLEMFARDRYKDWFAWGNEVNPDFSFDPFKTPETTRRMLATCPT